MRQGCRVVICTRCENVPATAPFAENGRPDARAAYVAPSPPVLPDANLRGYERPSRKGAHNAGRQPRRRAPRPQPRSPKRRTAARAAAFVGDADEPRRAPGWPAPRCTSRPRSGRGHAAAHPLPASLVSAPVRHGSAACGLLSPLPSSPKSGGSVGGRQARHRRPRAAFANDFDMAGQTTVSSPARSSCEGCVHHWRIAIPVRSSGFAAGTRRSEVASQLRDPRSGSPRVARRPGRPSAPARPGSANRG